MATEPWNIGDVRITKIIESEMEVPVEFFGEMLPKFSRSDVEAMRWLEAEYVRDGHFTLGYYSFLIATPHRKIVVDTAVGNAKPRVAPRFDMLDTTYLQNFGVVWKPDEVDAVVCTHLHVDPVGWNSRLDCEQQWVPTFPKATYHFVQTEFDHWKWFADNNESGHHPTFDAATVFADSVQPIVEAGLATFIEPDFLVTEEVSVIPSHGHTPGHISVLVQSRGTAPSSLATSCTARARLATRIGRPSTTAIPPPRPRRDVRS
jgi:glyoxylase-like metal-dependent hydrolase (beta-lactamase superfamily II)